MGNADCSLRCLKWLSVGLVVFLGSAMAHPLRAERASPEIRYLDTEVTCSGEDIILVRGAFEITGPPHRWYGVYFQLRVDAETPLQTKDGEAFLRLWNSIFTPENVNTARYTNCRLGIPLKEIASATNLPRGKRTVLWAVCDIWDGQQLKYLSSGWDVRAPLVVTTDQGGEIVKIETFGTAQLNPKKNHDSAKIKAKECALPLKHLKFKAGAKLYRAVGLRHEVYDILLQGDRQAELGTLDRGFFFDPVDSPEKAAELAQIGYPGAVIINTEQQYKAVVTALKGKGWQPGKDIRVDQPPSYGIKVISEPGLGYRVRALMIDFSDYYDLGLRDVVHREFAVTSEGRIGVARQAVCIVAPETPYGAPPGWKQPLPLGPEEYNKTLESILTTQGARHAARVAVTNKKATIPCAADAEAGWFLENYEDWPEHANK